MLGKKPAVFSDYKNESDVLGFGGLLSSAYFKDAATANLGRVTTNQVGGMIPGSLMFLEHLNFYS